MKIKTMFLDNQLKIFSGSASKQLAKAVCDYLKIPIGNANVARFPDGEKYIKLKDDVRGRDCFVIQSTCSPVDDNLVELLIFLDCLRRASAGRITAVIPYFGYARQDRKDEGRVPITAKLVANLIATAGANRVIAIDLHAQQLQGFFDIPVDHLTGEMVLREYFKKLQIDNLTIVSPDVGNMKIAAKYASYLGGDLAIVHKKRINGEEVEAEELIGDVQGKNVLMCDDIIATAGTLCSAAKLVKQKGAANIYVGATHGVFATASIQRIKDAPVTEVVITDTIPLNDNAKQLDNVKVLTVSEMLGEAIKRIHKNESVSSLFTDF